MAEERKISECAKSAEALSHDSPFAVFRLFLATKQDLTNDLAILDYVIDNRSVALYTRMASNLTNAISAEFFEVCYPLRIGGKYTKEFSGDRRAQPGASLIQP